MNTAQPEIGVGRLKVVYIAGYGRSGSTVLGALLGVQPGFLHVGEVAFLADDWGIPGQSCSCGEDYPVCEFWRGVLSDTDWREHARAVRSVERLRALPKLILGLHGKRTLHAYQTVQRKILHHAVVRGGASILVDGSKSAWLTAGRPLALQRFIDADVYVLHLVRGRRSTLRSIESFPSNWAAEGKRANPRWPQLRGTAGWMVANLVAVAVGKWGMGSTRYLRISYEEIVADPIAAVDRMSKFLSEDLSYLTECVQRRGAFAVGHIVGGSRTRFDGRLTLRVNSAPDSGARQ